MSQDLLIESTPPLTIFTINREARRNALHGPLWWALRDEARRLSTHPPRALVVCGAGLHFSAGMDLKPDNPLVSRLLPAIQTQSKDDLLALIRDLKEVVDAIATVPCPVIAAVEGVCTGGGLELALACDFRVASKNATFSLPEARVGMMPDVGGSVRLSRIVGRTRALDLILTNRQIDADTAMSWGLVNRLCEPGTALDAAKAMVAELATSSPTATREVLGLLRSASPSFEEETQAGARVLASGETLEGLMAFAEKRAPRWSSE